MQTFLDALPMAMEKMIAARQRRTSKPDRSTRRRLSDRVPANTLYETVEFSASFSVANWPEFRRMVFPSG